MSEKETPVASRSSSKSSGKVMKYWMYRTYYVGDQAFAEILR